MVGKSSQASRLCSFSCASGYNNTGVYGIRKIYKQYKTSGHINVGPASGTFAGLTDKAVPFRPESELACLHLIAPAIRSGNINNKNNNNN